MRINGNEIAVLESLWRVSPQTGDQLAADVAQARGCSEGSVRIMVCRLVAKGAVTALIEGAKFLYVPALLREDYVTGEPSSLINRLFDESLMSLSCHFAEALDPEDPEIGDILRKIDEAA